MLLNGYLAFSCCFCLAYAIKVLPTGTHYILWQYYRVSAIWFPLLILPYSYLWTCSDAEIWCCVTMWSKPSVHCHTNKQPTPNLDVFHNEWKQTSAKISRVSSSNEISLMKPLSIRNLLLSAGSHTNSQRETEQHFPSAPASHTS